MPELTRDDMINERFWVLEVQAGYELALKIVADEYGITCAEVERILMADDALNTDNC